METLSQSQDTIRFWFQFVTVNILAYFGLFNAIRYRNWHLHNGSIKLLAAVFSAFDRPIYQTLIPCHIFDILSLPESVLQHLQRKWPSFVPCSGHKMEHLLNHLSFRASCMNNFRQQLFPERAQHVTSFRTVLLARIRNLLSMLNACWRPFVNL